MDKHSPAVIKMAMEMFLGLSIGDWVPTIIPTKDDHRIGLQYKGKKAKPFKLLYAAVRPSTPKVKSCLCGESTVSVYGTSKVKIMRPTIYFNSFQVDLEAQIIYMYGAKSFLPVEVFNDLKRDNPSLINDMELVKQLLLGDFETCLRRATYVVNRRAEIAHTAQRVKNPNNKLRRLASKVVKEIYGSEATLSSEHNDGIAQYVLQTPEQTIRFEGVDGTFGGENERDILRMVIAHVSETYEEDAEEFFEGNAQIVKE